MRSQPGIKPTPGRDGAGARSFAYVSLGLSLIAILAGFFPARFPKGSFTLAVIVVSMSLVAAICGVAIGARAARPRPILPAVALVVSVLLSIYLVAIDWLQHELRNFSDQ